ncbi:HNH endonuclease, partial [Flexivirga sp.]|uniref:HNH endonuclease n=1 Tax=Flexivirga sp. TaxID=1962927 RepID=UPI003F7CDC3F
IIFRDHTCRTPWCTAPIRHIDHIQRHTDGGDTSERNGQGLCERCNYDKEHPDHHVTGTAAATITTIGGLTATSRPPAPPGLPPPTRSHVERTLIDITWHHDLSSRETDEPDAEETQ